MAAGYDAMESGLIGSQNYVANLTSTQRDNIALYLNFDIIGSPSTGSGAGGRVVVGRTSSESRSSGRKTLVTNSE